MKTRSPVPGVGSEELEVGNPKYGVQSSKVKSYETL